MSNLKVAISITSTLSLVLTLFPAFAQSQSTSENRTSLICSDDSYLSNEGTSQEDADTLFMKGFAFEHGLEVEQDYRKAIHWYCLANAKGHVDAEYNLGEIYLEMHLGGEEVNPVEALKWIIRAASLGSADANRYMGMIFYNGLGGIPRDYERAAELYQIAAEKGNSLAAYELGLMYRDGRGVPQNYAEAFRLFRRAANQLLVESEFRVGYAYQAGEGVQKDDVKAAIWYRKAAERGYAMAQNNLGTLYATGQGVEQNHIEAAGWYRKAAEQGFDEAQLTWGIILAGGHGVEANPAEGIRWMRLAADQGHAEAQFRIGYIYASGFGGVSQNDIEALRWFRRAAEQGHEQAREMLDAALK